MSKTENLNVFLKDVADTIRDVEGSSNLINPQHFSDRIVQMTGGTPNGQFDPFKKSDVNVFMKDIADTLRDVEGSIDLINPQDFSDRIKKLAGGEVEPSSPNLVCVYNITDTSEETYIVGDTSGFTSMIVDGVEMDADNSFYQFDTEGLHTIEFVLYNNEIPMYAFDSCTSLTNVTIPNSVNSIGEGAFCYCESLTSVTIPNSVTTIGTDGGTAAFFDCTGELVVNCNVPKSAFKNSKFTTVTFGDGVTTIGEDAFGGCSSLTSVTIPNSVTSIGDWAFCGCGLTGVTIPDSVTSIGEDAFGGCFNLTSVTIPNSVTSIGNSAFGGCSSLMEINSKHASEDGRCLIVDGTLNSFAPAGLTEYTIPDSVTSIGDWAFCDCSSLTSVTIPNSVNSIGEGAFGGCSSLTSIIIPDSVTTIEDDTFNGCSSLTSIIIPDGVTTIGYSAFRDCSSLTSVTIPDSVTSIRNSAFYNCNGLTSVYCKPTTPPALGRLSTGTSAFEDNASGRKIYVPTASVDAYKSATPWNEYASAIVGYNF